MLTVGQEPHGLIHTALCTGASWNNMMCAST